MNDGTTIGVDEVGRGPWAGPLVAAVVCLPSHIDTGGIVDSKQLTSRKRSSCYRYLQQFASAVGIGWVSAECIDQHGLTYSTSSAMYAAWLQLPGHYREHTVLVDGDTEYLADRVPASQCIPRGDQNEPAIAAASIVAKTIRDQFMRVYASVFPEYGFDAHVGYGTKQHKEALQRYGACSLHRYSFAPVKKVSSK